MRQGTTRESGEPSGGIQHWKRLGEGAAMILRPVSRGLQHHPASSRLLASGWGHIPRPGGRVLPEPSWLSGRDRRVPRLQQRVCDGFAPSSVSRRASGKFRAASG